MLVPILILASSLVTLWNQPCVSETYLIDASKSNNPNTGIPHACAHNPTPAELHVVLILQQKENPYGKLCSV